LYCRDHLFYAIEKIIFGQFKQSCKPLDFFIEKSIFPFLTKLENGLGLSIVQILSVLRLEHFDDCVDLGSEGIPFELIAILTIVKKFIDALNPCLLHCLALLSCTEGDRLVHLLLRIYEGSKVR
jgi:hypothetical protein